MYNDHGGSSKKKLKKLPDFHYTPSSKTCNQRNCYGLIYTCRIRVRAGKKEYIKTSSYNDDTFETKKQLQFIVGTFCTDCGHFEEDQEFKKLREAKRK